MAAGSDRYSGAAAGNQRERSDVVHHVAEGTRTSIGERRLPLSLNDDENSVGRHQLVAFSMIRIVAEAHVAGMRKRRPQPLE